MNDDLKDLIAAQAADYYVARSGGHSTADEDREFLEWLRTSPLHVAEYMAIVRIAKDAANATRQSVGSLDELVAAACADEPVVALLPVKQGAGSPAKPWGRRFVLAAAVAAVVLVAGLSARHWQPAPGQVYATVRGEQRTLQLSDNSVVRLDSESTIRVAFDGNRRLIDVMQGRAYFEVAKDASRPFQVRAGGAVIDDIGTVFEVFRTSADTSADTVVTVVDGLVKVHRETQGALFGEKAAADLGAGDQATIMATGAVTTRKLDNVQKAIAWTRNEIAFDGETVASVVAEFNRYNRIQIVVEDPAVAALPITGVFHTFDIQSFSQFLAGLPNVQVLETDRVVRVIGTRHDG